jgi:hypothetical protein
MNRIGTSARASADLRQEGDRTDEAPPTSVEGLLENVAPAVNEGSITLLSGRRVEAEATPEGDRLCVRAPGGAVVLTVLVTDAGPVLRFESAALELAAARKVSVTCERFDVVATEGASLTTGGDLVERIGGGATRDVTGAAKLSGAQVEVEARRGDIRAHANDDVDLKGERIRLNCDEAPMASTWDEFIARARAAAGEDPGQGPGH